MENFTVILPHDHHVCVQPHRGRVHSTRRIECDRMRPEHKKREKFFASKRKANAGSGFGRKRSHIAPAHVRVCIAGIYHMHTYRNLTNTHVRALSYDLHIVLHGF